MKLLTLLLACASLFSTASAQSRFTRFELPQQVSVEVPQNWLLLSGDIKTTVEVAGEAAIKLAGLDFPAEKNVNLLSARSMPKSTYASIIVHATDSEIAPDEIRLASKSDLKEFELALSDVIRKSLPVQKLQFIESLGLERKIVSGHVAIVFDYRRTSPTGPVTVSLTRLFIGSKEITFILSFKDDEGQLWMPVIEYMKQSIKVGK